VAPVTSDAFNRNSKTMKNSLVVKGSGRCRIEILLPNLSTDTGTVRLAGRADMIRNKHLPSVRIGPYLSASLLSRKAVRNISGLSKQKIRGINKKCH